MNLDKAYTAIFKMPLSRYLRLKKRLIGAVEVRQRTTSLLTVGEAAKTLQVSRKVVLVMAEDTELICNVGMMAGYGHGEFDSIKDYTLETSD